MPGADGLLANVQPDSLGLSAGLVEALQGWTAEYDRVFEDCGGTVSGEDPSTIALHEQGLSLWQQTVSEVGDRYEVHFDSPVHGDSFQVHRPLVKHFA
jgi:hypothetical protein